MLRKGIVCPVLQITHIAYRLHTEDGIGSGLRPKLWVGVRLRLLGEIPFQGLVSSIHITVFVVGFGLVLGPRPRLLGLGLGLQ